MMLHHNLHFYTYWTLLRLLTYPLQLLLLSLPLHSAALYWPLSHALLGRNTAPAGRLSASWRLIMTRLFLGPSHRVSFVRSLSGVSASAAFARTLPAPICPLFDSSDYSAVFRLRHLKPTHYLASSSRVPLTSLGPTHALPPGVWSHFHCSSP